MSAGLSSASEIRISALAADKPEGAQSPAFGKMGGDVAVTHAVLTKIADVEVDVHKGRFRARHQDFGPIFQHLGRVAVESNGTPMTAELGDSDPLWVLLIKCWKAWCTRLGTMGKNLL